MLRMSFLVIGAAFALAQVGVTHVGLAQTIGPGGGIMAPGPSQPQGYTPGGTGAGGVTVAPGPAARGVNVERNSPGGRLAPGSAGSVSTAPNLRAPAVTRTRAAVVKKAKRRPVHIKKRKRTTIRR